MGGCDRGFPRLSGARSGRRCRGRAPQAQRPVPQQSSNGRLGWVVHHGSQVTDISDNAKALQAVFLEEASEILEDIERDLLDLETSPGNRTLVDGLFRQLHTMKGSAGVAGMEELAHYTHAVESMLDEVRSGRIAMSSVLASLLLEALDSAGLLPRPSELEAG